MERQRDHLLRLLQPGLRLPIVYNTSAYVNTMGQYHPAGAAKSRPHRYPELQRGVTPDEVAAACHAARRAGLYRFDQRS